MAQIGEKYPYQINNYGGNQIEDIGLIEVSNGWKVAHIIHLNPLILSGLSHGIYSQSEVSTCYSRDQHVAPFIGCACGFYSFYEKSRASDLLTYARGLVLVKVENYGKIIFHTYGQRSQEQDIISLSLPNKCSKIFCSNNTTNLSQFKNKYKQRCDKHASNTSLNLSALRANTGVDIDILAL